MTYSNIYQASTGCLPITIFLATFLAAFLAAFLAVFLAILLAELTFYHRQHRARQIERSGRIVISRNWPPFSLTGSVTIRFFSLIMKENLLCGEGQVNTRFHKAIANIL